MAERAGPYRTVPIVRWLWALTALALLCIIAGCTRPTRIIFASDQCGTPNNEFDFDLFALTVDDGQVTRLTYQPKVEGEEGWMTGGGNISPNFPSVSPDGKVVAFTGWARGMAMHIYTMDSDGSNITDLMDGYTGCHHPCWSPDGNHIAFARFGPHVEDPGICTIRPDGTDLRLLIEGRATDEDWSDGYTPDTEYGGLDWSPDGTRIVFARSGSGDDNAFLQSLYIMNADGTSVHEFTQPPIFPGEDRDPRWSPDGNHIAYRSLRNGTWELIVSDAPAVDAVDANRTVTGSRYVLGDVGEFAWSPDGRSFVVVSTKDDNNQLWTCDVDGGNLKELTSGAGNCVSPCWFMSPQQPGSR